MDAGAGFAFAADGATAAAGGFNAVWLTAYRIRDRRPERLFAAATLALINAGIAAQAIFAQALYSAHRFAVSDDALFSTPAWLASRVVLLAGTVLLSVLIVRRGRR